MSKENGIIESKQDFFDKTVAELFLVIAKSQFELRVNPEIAVKDMAVAFMAILATNLKEYETNVR